MYTVKCIQHMVNSNGCGKWELEMEEDKGDTASDLEGLTDGFVVAGL